jgi:hypothetical protein
MLREVKYLQQRNCSEQPIPESAATVYAHNETYRKFIQNLDVVVSLYNRLILIIGTMHLSHVPTLVRN